MNAREPVLHYPVLARFDDVEEPAAPGPPDPSAQIALWADLDHIQEAGAQAAIVGIDLADLQRRYTGLFDQASQFLTRRFNLQDGAVAGQLDRLEAHLRRLEAWRDDLIALRHDVPPRLLDLAREEAEQDAEALGIVQRMGAVQPAGRQRLQLAEDTHRRERELAEARHRRTLAEERTEIAASARAVNDEQLRDAEAARRAALEEARSLLGAVRQRSHALQIRGLTRSVSRFLNWMPLVSFGGVGLVLARLFSSRLLEAHANASGDLLPLGVVYIGVIYTILSASSGLLFWVFVLRPAHEGETVARPVAAYYSAIFALPVLALVALAILPATATNLARASLGITLVVAASAFGLGPYLKGIFRHEDDLDRTCGRLRDELEDTTRRPAVQDYLDDQSPASRPPPAATVRPSLPLQRVSRWFTSWRTTPSERADRLISPEEVPVELIDRLASARAAHAAARASRVAAESALSRADREYPSALEATARCRAELEDHQRKRVAVLERYETDMLKLKAGYERASIALAQAYNMSRLAAGGAR